VALLKDDLFTGSLASIVTTATGVSPCDEHCVWHHLTPPLPERLPRGDSDATIAPAPMNSLRFTPMCAP
jgi:hypothetical protein